MIKETFVLMCKILFSIPKVLLTYNLNFLKRVKARIDYTLGDTSYEHEMPDKHVVSEHIMKREQSYDQFISDLKSNSGIYEIPHEEVDKTIKQEYKQEIAD